MPISLCATCTNDFAKCPAIPGDYVMNPSRVIITCPKHQKTPKQEYSSKCNHCSWWNGRRCRQGRIGIITAPTIHIAVCPDFKRGKPVSERVHLCDTCTQHFATCQATDDAIQMGSPNKPPFTGDNVISCKLYIKL